ncbi:MAG: o-succinylbenzoate synthase [Cephaloticoccus sp.]|nr:o-succinylbenzoate synthase [Cephaloticoccus sp.]MCF7760489.1 o-succinylbenzoate synthase [Cephaloticoccus sp.]
MAPVEYLFAHRRYCLPFRSPVRTAHGLWTEREGILLRMTAGNGTVRFGEVSPIPWFGTETVDEAEKVCRALGEKVNDARLQAVPENLGCLRGALAAARLNLDPPTNPAPRQIAALLPAGKAALELIETRVDAGFRIFKWKVGVADTAMELGLLDDVCSRLPDGAKLRLDANGKWDRRTAERWLERCAERPVEFVEQPCFAEAAQGTVQQRKVEDLLMGLTEDYPTPLALDESLVGQGDVARWINAGWPGFYVVKTALLADPTTALAALEKAKAKVVFSSALETAIGARAALRLAFAWSGEPHALGFGVWPLFDLPGVNGPATAPFVRWEDVQRIEEATTWNACN